MRTTFQSLAMRCLVLHLLQYAVGGNEKNALVCLKIFWTREQPLVNGLAMLDQLRICPHTRQQSIVIGHIPTKQGGCRHRL